MNTLITNEAKSLSLMSEARTLQTIPVTIHVSSYNHLRTHMNPHTQL